MSTPIQQGLFDVRMRNGDSHTGQNGPMAVGTAISLFSGAGGLDLGVEAAGYRTLAAVEWDNDAVDTMQKNADRYFPELQEVLRADLFPLATGTGEGLSTKDIRRAAGLTGRERPDLLVGGPPCVAFSKSGFWLDWKRDGVDPAASLLQAYTRVLAEIRPRHFILENVYALTFDNREPTGLHQTASRDRIGWLPLHLAGTERCGLRRTPAPSAPVHCWRP